MTQSTEPSGDWWQWSGIGAISPLARRIIIFNLATLGVLMCCILWVYGTSGRSELDQEMRLLSEAELIAELIELRLPQESPTLSSQGLRAVSLETLLGVRLRKGPYGRSLYS